MPSKRNIVLTGFMGTGKSTIGRRIAQEMGMGFIDTDSRIELSAGMSVSEIFEKHGEPQFRAYENKLCLEMTDWENTVIATGGGMPINPVNRRHLNQTGIAFNLNTAIPELVKRLSLNSCRPLAQSSNLEECIRDLLRLRNAAYSSFPFQVDTTGGVPEILSRKLIDLATKTAQARCLMFNDSETSGRSIVLGSGVLDHLGSLLSNRGLSARIAVVTDTNLERLYLPEVMGNLKAAGFKPFECVVQAGEQSKNMAETQSLYSKLIAGKLDRKGAVIALGGGVIGDLAGFVAATYMRGVGLVQCPTTFLAMVDSSVGGKTGVDLPEGKNLVGAFKQPIIVVADTDTLSSLPESEIRNGMAETIKHAIIGDAEFFDALENRTNWNLITPELVQTSLTVKIKTVEADPFEQNIRATLNFGHTVGHSIEKVMNFQVSHGSAVAIGMIAAAVISEKMQLCSSATVERIRSLIQTAGLPIRHSANVEEIIRATKSDKKAVDQDPKFVLVEEIGKVRYGISVSNDALADTLQTMRED